MQRGARQLQQDLLDQLAQVREHRDRVRRRLAKARTMSDDGLTVERAIDLTATDLDLIGGCLETMHRLLVTTYEDLTRAAEEDEAAAAEDEGLLAERLAVLEEQVACLLRLTSTSLTAGNGDGWNHEKQRNGKGGLL
jgi:hypothetical protein